MDAKGRAGVSTIQGTKSERVQVRIDRGGKRLLKRVAALANTTVSAFVVNSALDAAGRLIRERRQIVLNERAWDVFLDAVLDPPKPKPALRRAFAAHRRLVARTVGD
jgi:uncharacterized protein (DUF1778 family)